MRELLPAGRYYIGDPCYVIPDDEWSAFLRPYWDVGDGVFLYKETPVFAASTAWGDGGYRGSDGMNYDVDAGMIGCVPESLCDSVALNGTLDNGSGSIQTFDEPFYVECNEGVFKIDKLTIDTYGHDDEEGGY